MKTARLAYIGEEFAQIEKLVRKPSFESYQ